MNINVKNEKQNETITHDGGVLELGRSPDLDGLHFVIEDPYVSRQQLRVEARNGGRVCVENIGGTIKHEKGSIGKGTVREFDLPMTVRVGRTVIEIHAAVELGDSSALMQTISQPIRPQSSDLLDGKSILDLGTSPSPDTLAHWFETLVTVQRSAAGSDEFYKETAEAVVSLVGLDRGLVLLRKKDEGWETRGQASRGTRTHSGYSTTVLKQVLSEKRTFFEIENVGAIGPSLVSIESVVASPIFDREDAIVGVVYGSRDQGSGSGRSGIEPLEAQLVQLLAGAVSVGLARADKEAEAARMRVQFESFSSPELARELERNPDLLDPREREVTVAFSDLRGFSRITERLAPEQTYELVKDVMNCLTNCILARSGVIIDYYGDGVAAMWNAPTDVPDHASLACHAALDMRKELPGLNERWESIVGDPLDVGVGISTGKAQVGNSGSSSRLKYGPRGHAVNLSSRLEGATKQFRVPVLISGATWDKMAQEAFATRRLGKIAAKGMEGAVDVFELYGTRADAQWRQYGELYESALKLFESGALDESRSAMEPLMAGGGEPKYGPFGILWHQLGRFDGAPGADFDAVFRLDRK